MTPGAVEGRRLRVLLVKPQARLGIIRSLQRFQLMEPLELGYLAAAVPAGPRGHDVRVLDLRFAHHAERRFAGELRAWRPDIIGITGYTHEAGMVKILARHARRELPAATVVVGGHHATVVPEDFAIPEIDVVVRGEGCGPLGEIVAAVAAGRPATAAVPAVAGCLPVVVDPARLPVPRRDLWPPERYFSVWTGEAVQPFTPLFPPVALVRTSFGCKMRCSFCIVPQLYGGEHHPRPVEQVADEIAGLVPEHVYFCDDENFLDEDFAHALAAALAARGVKKRYFAWTRATTVNRSPELFRRWRALGLEAAFLGFEFTSDAELRAVRKGSSLASNGRAHAALRELGIAVHAGFMLMPEWGAEDFARLGDYVARMPPAQCSFTVCTPSPGTEAYAAMRGRFWVDDPFALHDCMHPLVPTKLPLREFAQRYAAQVWRSGPKNPLRVGSRPLRPRDLWRVVRAEALCMLAYRRSYRDYPRRMWDRAAP